MWLSLIICCVLILAAMSVQAENVQSSDIHFGSKSQYHGYLARPSGQGPFPGIVVIHEWWGLNDNIRTESDKLASEGYVALAVDLFGKTTTDAKEAHQLVQNLNQQDATTELLAAANHLRSLSFVRPDRIGSIGWCFGGGQSLNLAINDPKLAACVVYYGQPVTDSELVSKVNAALIGLYGEADQSIPIAKVQAFDKALTQANVAHVIHTYPNAGHAFANPSRGDAYKPEAAADAWKNTLMFLEKYLKR